MNASRCPQRAAVHEKEFTTHRGHAQIPLPERELLKFDFEQRESPINESAPYQSVSRRIPGCAARASRTALCGSIELW